MSELKSANTKWHFYSVPNSGAEYCDECVCVCLSVIISLEVHVQSSPKFLCMLPRVAQSSSGGTVICYTFPGYGYLHISWGCSTVDVAARLRQWHSHAALVFAHRNTCSRQWMLKTTSCSQGLRCSGLLLAVRAYDAQDYFLQSGPTRPQWAC